MYVEAASVGYAVPRISFDSVVHSVFESVVNLKTSKEDQLLTLLISGDTDLPHGIRLDPSNRFCFEGLPVGIRAVCRGGVLSMAGQSLTIDLRKAKCWESNLLTLQPDMNDAATVAAWRSVWQAVNDRQMRYGSGIVARDLTGGITEEQPVWIQQVSRSTCRLLKATIRCDLEATPAVESLIGLGPGLTPSGDDLVAGYLIGLWCTTKGRKERLRFLSALGKAVVDLSKRTNDISRTYLYHAAHGQASSRLVNLAIAVCAGENDDHVLGRASDALQLGHTSGMDAVTGLLFGLAAWDGAHLLGEYLPTAV